MGVNVTITSDATSIKSRHDTPGPRINIVLMFYDTLEAAFNTLRRVKNFRLHRRARRACFAVPEKNTPVNYAIVNPRRTDGKSKVIKVRPRSAFP